MEKKSELRSHGAEGTDIKEERKRCSHQKTPGTIKPKKNQNQAETF